MRAEHPGSPGLLTAESLNQLEAILSSGSAAFASKSVAKLNRSRPSRSPRIETSRPSVSKTQPAPGISIASAPAIQPALFCNLIVSNRKGAPSRRRKSRQYDHRHFRQAEELRCLVAALARNEVPRSSVTSNGWVKPNATMLFAIWWICLPGWVLQLRGLSLI